MKSILTCTALLASATLCSEEKQGEQQCKSYDQAQGEPLECRNPAYNAPAAINTGHKVEDTNFFIDAAFTYWFAGEDGLKVASTGVYSSGTGAFYFAQNTKTLNQSFDYKPGFKVGLGIIGSHEWVFQAEYTWFRGTNTKHSSSLSATALVPTAGTVAAPNGINVWVVDDWFLQGTGLGQALAGSSVSSSWRLAMDIADAVVGRPFYQGKCVTISPFAGLRSAWIRQKMNVKLTEAASLFNGTALPVVSAPLQPIESRNKSHSWSIGPRVGLDGQLLLPRGFRFEGNFAASLLFTQYDIHHSEDIGSTAFNLGPYTANVRNYNCLRPEADLGLGIGWGKYIYGRDYHIDFSADYDFMYFWGQNVMRQSLDNTLTGTGPAAGDLYLHGLTFTVRFDF